MRKDAGVTRRILILPDAHYPHHDPEVMAVVEAAVAVLNPDEIVVLGDWLDAENFSGHPRLALEEQRFSYLADEVAPCNDMLDKLQGANYSRRLVYIGGNHEDRVERFLANQGGGPAEDLFKLASPQRCLTYRVGKNGEPGDTRRRNFTYIPYRGSGTLAHYKITPNLIAIHGWSFAQNFNVVNQRAEPGLSIVCGHVHRRDVHYARSSVEGVERRYWSPGCLCKLQPLYMASTPHDWVHGFSIVYQSERRGAKTDWTAYDIGIHAGRAILPDGTEVRG